MQGGRRRERSSRRAVLRHGSDQANHCPPTQTKHRPPIIHTCVSSGWKAVAMRVLSRTATITRSRCCAAASSGVRRYSASTSTPARFTRSNGQSEAGRPGHQEQARICSGWAGVEHIGRLARAARPAPATAGTDGTPTALQLLCLDARFNSSCSGTAPRQQARTRSRLGDGGRADENRSEAVAGVAAARQARRRRQLRLEAVDL